MKTTLFCLMLGLLLCGCSTVQVASLDTTLNPTKVIDFYRTPVELMGKPHREIGYVAYNSPVSNLNYTKALGVLLKKARRIGADGLILETPPESLTDETVFRGIAIVYDK